LKISRFSLPKKSTHGKSFANKRILRTSSKLSKIARRYAITYSITQKCLGIVSSFFFIPFKNRFLSLLILSNGLICYTPALENQSFFQYFKTVSKLNTRFYKFQIFFNRIAYIKKLSLISLLELSPSKGAQYIRGVGAKGRLFAIDKIENTAIVELPSKLKKLFPLFSVCAIGRLMGEENRFFANTKSGY
jgi:ribosomal protein L2